MHRAKEEVRRRPRSLAVTRDMIARVCRDKTVCPPVNGTAGKDWRRVAHPFVD